MLWLKRPCVRSWQKLQVPNIAISKCAACLKPPTSEEDKLKRCTRCYRVGYCNQSVKRVSSTAACEYVFAPRALTCTLFPKHRQGLSADPLAQPQELVSTQRRERGPAFPGQRARVPPLLRPSEPAAGGLLQVGTPSLLIGCV